MFAIRPFIGTDEMYQAIVDVENKVWTVTAHLVGYFTSVISCNLVTNRKLKHFAVFFILSLRSASSCATIYQKDIL